MHFDTSSSFYCSTLPVVDLPPPPCTCMHEWSFTCSGLTTFEMPAPPLWGTKWYLSKKWEQTRWDVFNYGATSAVLIDQWSMSSRLSKHQGKVSQTLWSTTTITTSLSSDRDQLTTVHTKGLHKGSLSILNLRRGDLRGLFHVSKIGTLNAWGELHYNSFSCFTSACHMTSVWSTSSDLSYSIETILTLISVKFMYLQS